MRVLRSRHSPGLYAFSQFVLRIFGIRTSNLMSLLQMMDITKQFPGVLALDKAQLSVEAGECHALVGENGAGKSTLMKILSGAYQPDSGVIKLDGSAQQVTSPIVARKLGITMIHQELNLLPEMTVAENIFLGSRDCPWPTRVVG